MRTLIKISLLLLLIKNASAQDLQMDVDLEGMRPFGFVRINDMKDVRSRPVANINYDDVDGSSFWSDNWNAAILYSPTYKIILPEAKLNFYSNEIWYKNDTGQVIAISPGTINKVIFYKGNDTAIIAAKFVYLQNTGESNNHYFEVLNEGKTQLLKLHNVILIERPYDVIQGKHVYGFVDKPDYYLSHDNDTIKLHNLSREVVLPIIQPAAEDQDWLKKNYNKLKNEKDFVAFFDYFNKQQHLSKNSKSNNKSF